MHELAEGFVDLASTLGCLFLDHLRGLAGLALVASLLVGGHAMLHEYVTGQTAQAAAFDQLSTPLPMGAPLAQQSAAQQKWIAVQ